MSSKPLQILHTFSPIPQIRDWFDANYIHRNNVIICNNAISLRVKDFVSKGKKKNGTGTRWFDLETSLQQSFSLLVYCEGKGSLGQLWKLWEWSSLVNTFWYRKHGCLCDQTWKIPFEWVWSVHLLLVPQYGKLPSPLLLPWAYTLETVGVFLRDVSVFLTLQVESSLGSNDLFTGVKWPFHKGHLRPSKPRYLHNE